MRYIRALFGVACAALGLAAGRLAAAPIDWSYGGQLELAPSRLTGGPRLQDELNTLFRYRYRFVELLADLALVNDERYEPEEPFTLGHQFLIRGGGVALDFDFLSLRAGRFVHRDLLDTPYSLFISSQDLPALLADITLHGGPFTYESRWIRLNSRSAALPVPFPDRGANYKVFALELGAWRFGVQDSAVYTGTAFDAEYFLSPMPAILTQMVTRRDTTPWQEQANDNSIMGLFAEWRPAGQYYYAQWLVDDLSLDSFIPWFLRDRFGDRRIASKTAWSMGGRWELPFGRLGFYHAGATKYTFEATRDDAPYGYVYYPATRYMLDGSPMTLDYPDNYLGYKYGENNLAFMLELVRPLLGADFRATLEYVVSGSKSPANPWHDAASAAEAGRYTQMLDDPVLEHTVAAEVSASWPWRSWAFSTRLRLGGVFNRLGLEDAVEGPTPHQAIFRPQAGENALLYALTLGVSYTFHIGGTGGPGR